MASPTKDSPSSVSIRFISTLGSPMAGTSRNGPKPRVPVKLGNPPFKGVRSSRGTLISIKIILGGPVGTARYKWNWEEGGVSGTGITNSAYQLIVNDLQVRWPAELNLQVNEEWRLEVIWPKGYQKPPKLIYLFDTSGISVSSSAESMTIGSTTSIAAAPSTTNTSAWRRMFSR